MKMTLFWLLWSLNVLILLVALYFFFVGLVDGSVSSFNATLWIGVLAGIIGIVVGSWLLKSFGNIKGANILLSVLAIPATLFFLVIIISFLTKARWN